jgi:uncharacterized protein YegL
MIDTQVVGNTHGPTQELAFVVVPVVADGINDLDKHILKQVFGQVLVFYEEKNGSVNPVFIPVYQSFQCGSVSGIICLNELRI